MSCVYSRILYSYCTERGREHLSKCRLWSVDGCNGAERERFIGRPACLEMKSSNCFNSSEGGGLRYMSSVRPSTVLVLFSFKPGSSFFYVATGVSTAHSPMEASRLASLHEGLQKGKAERGSSGGLGFDAASAKVTKKKKLGSSKPSNAIAKKGEKDREFASTTAGRVWPSALPREKERESERARERARERESVRAREREREREREEGGKLSSHSAARLRRCRCDGALGPVGSAS